MSQRGVHARACWRYAGIGAAGAVLLVSGACGASRRAESTRFRVSDVEFAAGSLRASLLASSFMAGRDRRSEPFVIMADEAVNLSAERLPEADRWAVVSMILYDPEVRSAFESANVHVHLTPEKRAIFRRYVLPGSGADPYDLPPDTHLFRVRFHSLQRAAAVEQDAADARKDVFLVDAEIVELSTGRGVWAGESRLARAARGLILD